MIYYREVNMKKIVFILALLTLTSTAFAVENNVVVSPVKATEIQKQHQERINRDIAFEKRLGLTEVQKLKAREIRKTGHEKLKPILEQIKSKKQEAEMIRRSRMAVQMQEEKLTVIDTELRLLEKEAQAIRKSNMKEFESILTWDQKKTLKKMKKEGRQRYHQAHPACKHINKSFYKSK